MSRLYLASVHGAVDVDAQSNAIADFTTAWLAHLGERAARLVQDARLMACAADHAVYLDSRTGDELLHSMHIGRNNSTANERVRASGVTLPAYWPERGNQVESCARAYHGAAHTLALWLQSPPHRNHLNVSDWYSEHLLWGFAHAGFDYVFVSVPPESEQL